MTYFDKPDQLLIRRALYVMVDLATDELSAEEVEYMDSDNVAFIRSALTGLTKPVQRDLVDFEEELSGAELDRLAEILKLLPKG